MTGQYHKIDTALMVSHMMCHRPCCNVAESDVLAGLSIGSFFGLCCTKIANFGCFPRLLNLLMCHDTGYELFVLFEICSRFYETILFGYFFRLQALWRAKTFCIRLTEHVKL